MKYPWTSKKKTLIERFVNEALSGWSGWQLLVLLFTLLMVAFVAIGWISRQFGAARKKGGQRKRQHEEDEHKGSNDGIKSRRPQIAK
uniref:Uncharacterized protein n=1 Tax=Lutzomyia longipalpis TaxID=7200 RepID=A0A1B0CI18_LUTLO